MRSEWWDSDPTGLASSHREEEEAQRRVCTDRRGGHVRRAPSASHKVRPLQRPILLPP